MGVRSGFRDLMGAAPRELQDRLQRLLDWLVFKDELTSHDHSGGDGAQVDHGGLAGLTDDDHAQYLRADGTRALTANWDVGPYTVTADAVTIDKTTGNTLVVDASTLVADATNNRVGVGIAAPAYNFHVAGNTQTTFALESAGTAVPYYRFRRSRGTLASPANINSNDVIGRYEFDGYYGGVFAGLAGMYCKVGTIGAGSFTPKIVFAFSTDGETEADMFTLSSSGSLLIGTATDGMTSGGSLAVAKDLAHRGTLAGFYNTAPAAKPTVSGDREGNAALASALTGLSGLGLLTDSTTSTSPKRYALQAFSLQSSLVSLIPADGATYYVGAVPVDLDTTNAVKRIYIPAAGTINRADILWYAAGTAGSNENISIYVRLNDTTDTLIATVGDTNALKVFTGTALGIAVVAGDYIEIKIVCPTWATNPTQLRISGTVWVE